MSYVLRWRQTAKRLYGLVLVSSQLLAVALTRDVRVELM